MDTGFIVFNYWTYPNMLNFFKHLGVKVRRVPGEGGGEIHWRATAADVPLCTAFVVVAGAP